MAGTPIKRARREGRLPEGVDVRTGPVADRARARGRGAKGVPYVDTSSPEARRQVLARLNYAADAAIRDGDLRVAVTADGMLLEHLPDDAKLIVDRFGSEEEALAWIDRIRPLLVARVEQRRLDNGERRETEPCGETSAGGLDEARFGSDE